MKTIATIHAADVIALAISTPNGPRPDLDTLANAGDFANACGLGDSDVYDVDGPLEIDAEHDGADIRFTTAVTLSGVVEGRPDEQRVYLLGYVQ